METKAATAPAASPIDFYFDFISPYGYFGSTQIDALAARHGRTVAWRPFLLGVTVIKIMGLKPLMETPLKSDYVRLDKPRMARILGVPFVQREMAGVNSIRASRAFLALNEQDPAQARRFAQRIFARLWARGEDITGLDAVLEEAGAIGADTGWLAAEIASPAGRQRLEQAVAFAVANGVFGAPFFIVDGEPVWGVDRLWLVERLLQASAAP